MIEIAVILGVWLGSLLGALALVNWPVIAADWARLREWRNHLWDEENAIIDQDEAEYKDAVEQLCLEKWIKAIQQQEEAAHPILDPLGYDLNQRFAADLDEPLPDAWKHVPDEHKTKCYTGDEMAHD